MNFDNVIFQIYSKKEMRLYINKCQFILIIVMVIIIICYYF